MLASLFGVKPFAKPVLNYVPIEYVSIANVFIRVICLFKEHSWTKWLNDLGIIYQSWCDMTCTVDIDNLDHELNHHWPGSHILDIPPSAHVKRKMTPRLPYTSWTTSKFPVIMIKWAVSDLEKDMASRRPRGCTLQWNIRKIHYNSGTPNLISTSLLHNPQTHYW